MTIKEMCKEAHAIAKSKGFWDEDRNSGELIALMHSELSEALEGLRQYNSKSDKIPEYSQVEEELADCIIRIGDMCESRGYNLEGALKAKFEYNKKRKYMHGKKF